MKRTDFSVDWLFAACAPDTELLPWNAQFTPVDLPHDWQIRHADDLYRDGTLFYRKYFFVTDVPQAAPFIAEDAAAGAVAAERNDVAEHRDVAEHDVVHNGNEHHCVPLPVLFNVLHRGTLLLDSGHRSVFLCGLGHGSVSPS